MDPRKRLDLAVRAVALAHEKKPNLHFDIYGKGGEQENLQDLIDTLGAGDFIQLRGNADLREVYPQYELYVTASQWETFGLTLMEAVGAGLALVGFDARYGNPTFIKDGENGYLVTYSETMDEDLLVSQMADKIVFALEEKWKLVCVIANVLGMSKSSITHQLGTIRRKGIVKCRREGKEVYYMLDDEHVRQVFEVGVEHVEHLIEK